MFQLQKKGKLHIHYLTTVHYQIKAKKIQKKTEIEKKERNFTVNISM